MKAVSELLESVGLSQVVLWILMETRPLRDPWTPARPSTYYGRPTPTRIKIATPDRWLLQIYFSSLQTEHTLIIAM